MRFCEQSPNEESLILRTPKRTQTQSRRYLP